MNHLLKILEGRQKGAEIAVEMGRWHFGSDSENDLVLDDEAVLPHHFTMTIEEEAVFIVPADNAHVSLDGETLNKDGVQINHYQRVSVGHTVLAIGPPDGSWPIAEPEAEPAAASTPTYKSDLVKYLATSLLLLIGSVWAWQARPHEVKAAPKRVKVEEVLNELNLKQLTVEEDAQGNKRVTGQIISVKTAQELQARLEGSAVLAVVVVERLLAPGRDIVRAYLPGAQLSINDEGHLQLSGLSAEEAALAKLLAVLAEDLPQGIAVENKVLTPKDLYLPLKELLQELGLTKQLTFSIKDGRLLVHGTLPGDKLDAWNKARDAFTERHGLLILEQFDTPVAPIGKREDSFLKIHSVSIGEVSYITLEDGSKYFEGSILDNGAVLTHIAADHIVLQRDGQQKKFKLGG